MAKKSKIVKNEKRRQMAARYAARRAELKELIRSPQTPEDQREEALRKFHALPRDASPIRIRNRCHLTGRPRGNYRKFGLCRIALRERALRGELPGVTKASW